MLKKILYTILSTFILTILAGFFNPVWAQLDNFTFNDFTTGGAKIAGVPFQITITARESDGTPLTTYTDYVTLSDDTSTVYPTQSDDFSGGTWTGIVYITEAENTNYLYALDGSATGTSNVFTVQPDSRIKYLSVVSGNNQTGTVNTLLPSALTMKLVDPYDNPLSGQSVSFAITGYPSNATGQTLGTTSTTTSSSGQVSTTLTMGRKSGTYIVTGKTNSGVTTSVDFYETAESGPLMSISLDPWLAVMPTGSYLPFSAKGYDQFQNEKTFTALSWSVVNGGGTIDNTGIFTSGDVTGNFLNTVRASQGTVGAIASVSIISEGGGTGSGSGSGSGSDSGTTGPTPTPTASASATPTPSASASATPVATPVVISEVIVDPDFISALSGATIPITATAISPTGSVVTGVAYSFSIEGNLGELVQQTPSTVLLTASENGIGTVTVKATQGNVTKIAKIVGSVGTGLNRRLIIEDIPSPQQAGEPFLISVAARDSLNNLVTDYDGPLALADTTGTLDPAVASPSADGTWYVQGIINLAHDAVTVTVAADGMIGVSNIFRVEGDLKMSDIAPGGGSGGAGVKGASIAGQIKEFLNGKGVGGGTGIQYLGAGLAAGVGILGASIGGGYMASRGLEAIGRNPFAKGRLQFNLYGSLLAFVAAAGIALFASIMILQTVPSL